jgi:hypothetical protein
MFMGTYECQLIGGPECGVTAIVDKGDKWPHAYIDVDGSEYVICQEIERNLFTYAHVSINLEALYDIQEQWDE